MPPAPNQPPDERFAGGATDQRRAIDLLSPDPSVVEDAQPVSLDRLFETLADPGSRYVLTYLLRDGGSVSTGELVDYVLERTETSGSRRAFREEVAETLTHRLLPDLDADGFVDYDVERQRVATTSKTANALPYLQLALAHRRLQDGD